MFDFLKYKKLSDGEKITLDTIIAIFIIIILVSGAIFFAQWAELFW